MKFISKFSGIVFLIAAAFVTSSVAHNYHTSLTRIDYNKKAKSLEIEINLFNHDLEKVLEAKYKKPVDIEKSKDVDKILLEYLGETFVIKNADGLQKKLVWIGKEINVDLTTVFVEIPNIENYENLKLQNKIFFESFAEQINLVTLYLEDKKFDLLFKSGDTFKDFMSVDKKQEVSTGANLPHDFGVR